MPVFVKYRIFVSQLIEVVVSRNTVRHPKNKNKIKRRFLFRFGHTASINYEASASRLLQNPSTRENSIAEVHGELWECG